MRLALLAAVLDLVVLLGAAQLVLPGLAERKLRDDLMRSGSQVHVEVKAFPAVKLLFQHADRVTVDVSDYNSGGTGKGTSLADQLARTKSTQKLDVHVRVIED